MKRILITCLLTFSSTLMWGNIKNSLQGVWLCTKILDSKSAPTKGKFGASNEYLKFSFQKNKLSITESSFDPSNLAFTIRYGRNYIDLIPGSVLMIPEKVYSVKSVTSDNLILSTLGPDADSIYYHFANERLTSKGFDPRSTVINLGLVIIKHLKMDEGTNKAYQYYIPNTGEYLNPSPTFYDSKSVFFGDYFSRNFKFPESYKMDKLSEEIIVEFDIRIKDIGNIKVIQGDPEFDQEVIRALELTGKKWTPLKVNDLETECRVRMHFAFYLGKMELPEFGN